MFTLLLVRTVPKYSVAPRQPATGRASPVAPQVSDQRWLGATTMLLMLPLMAALSAPTSGDGGLRTVAAAAPPAPAPLLPTWVPTWDLQRSLVAMPCNESGWSDATEFAKIGIVTYDMNNAHDVWEATVPSSPEEVLEQQCARTKALSKDVKCGVYRNSAHM